MNSKKFFKDKKVVIMGLGLYGGGVASARFCLKNGASVTVTDLQTEEKLKPSLLQLSEKEKSKITFTLGKHQKKDFENADIIIVNPAVPRENKYLQIAKEKGASFENDISLFMKFNTTPIIAVTGTRGKTTTVNWISQLLSSSIGQIDPIGNSSNTPLLKPLINMYEVEPRTCIVELSSWQLELLPRSNKAPHISIITNIYPDHLNRYNNIEQYANAKTNIFKNQTKDDYLILNHDNNWCNFILKKKPTSSVLFVSKTQLPTKLNGIYVKNNFAVIRRKGIEKRLVSLKNFEEKWGVHNVENILTSLLAIYLFDPTNKITRSQIKNLIEIPFRQQTVYKDSSLQIINDTTSTSPDGLIAAINRFNNNSTIFIVGGTRKDVSFDKAAEQIKKFIPSNRLVLLSGSATNDLLKSLKKKQYDILNIKIFDNLESCIKHSLSKTKEKGGRIVFSPGSSSFEKFNNEFHRGEMFNKILFKTINS